MGCYSYYTLTAEDAEGRSAADVPGLFDALVRISGYGASSWDQSDGEIRSESEMKWYEHTPDLAALSAEFPALRFTLFVDGEDGAQSYIYAAGGNVEACDGDMVFPPRTIW